VSAPEEVRGAIKLRIPGWARNQAPPGELYSYVDKLEKATAILVNGRRDTTAMDRFGYVTIDRIWKNGDTIEVEFPMEPRKVLASPKVKDDRRRMAVERGPIVYCAEWPDLSGARALEMLMKPEAKLKTAVDKQLFNGVAVIEMEATSISNPERAAKAAKFIPY